MAPERVSEGDSHSGGASSSQESSSRGGVTATGDLGSVTGMDSRTSATTHGGAGSGSKQVVGAGGSSQMSSNDDSTVVSGKLSADGEVVVGDIYARTQGELNRYAGVKRVTGSIVLSGDPSLTSLKPLEELESIGGDLVLKSMYNLSRVDGLSALRTIGGDLSITHSNIITVNLDALGSVESIGGDYEVSDCDGELLLQRIGVEHVHGRVIAVGPPSDYAESCQRSSQGG